MGESIIVLDKRLSPGSSRRRVSWLGITVLLMLFIAIWFYWSRARMPQVVRIAGGAAEGRYADIAQGIAQELRNRFNTSVEVIETQGSLENLQLLQAGKADFGVYQPGTLSILSAADSLSGEPEPATFVSNLYPEFLMPVGSMSIAADSLNAAGKLTWSCNDRLSGNYAVTCLLLRHLGLDEDVINVSSIDHADLPLKIQDRTIDVSILCCGLDTPILKTLLADQIGHPLEIPWLDAFACKHPSLTRDEIPAGYFQTSPPVPAQSFQTVTLQAQLLASRDASVRLVEEVTRIVSDRRFQGRHTLRGLSQNGIGYATDRPEFPMHLGASHVFYPELKPLVNPDFVEGTEGIRSFVVSLIAAVWLLQRWWNHRQARGQEHRLDRCIKDLLQLERDQMEVDGEGGPEESRVLQQLLDQVTILRQEALAEFTAHELNEDRAADCFVQMCHALSDKINSKLLRHCILSTKRH